MIKYLKLIVINFLFCFIFSFSSLSTPPPSCPQPIPILSSLITSPLSSLSSHTVASGCSSQSLSSRRRGGLHSLLVVLRWWLGYQYGSVWVGFFRYGRVLAELWLSFGGVAASFDRWFMIVTWVWCICDLILGDRDSDLYGLCVAVMVVLGGYFVLGLVCSK